MAYSEYFRAAVLESISKDGLTLSQAAKLFEVSAHTIANWKKLKERTGELKRRSYPTRLRKITPEGAEFLFALRQAEPALTLEELAEEWERQTGVSVTAATVSRALKELCPA